MFKKYRVVGLRRSGNHAIINWIAYHFECERVLFMNDVNPKYDLFSEKNIKRHNRKLKRLEDHKPFMKYELSEDPINYDCLMYSHEERSLDQIQNNDDLTVFILRDPYNITASRLKGSKNNKYSKWLFIDDDFINILKQYLKEFAGETRIVKNKILINYNEWFKSRDYRQVVSKQLELEFSDDGFGKMSGHGKGSSFNGLVDDASKLDVLHRWKKYIDNELFKKVSQDVEINRLSELIFGNIFEEV